MSKKTRKKSPKAASRGTPRAQSGKSTKTVRAQSRPAKTGKSSKSGSRTTRKTGNATARASQKPHSKQLRSSASPRSARSKSAAVTSQADRTASTKSPAASTLTPATHKSGLSEGAKAPAFRLPRDGGGTVSLSDYSGKKLVLFFYPRAGTPGCTKEAIDFSRLSSAFAESQTAVLGISADPPHAQEAFRDKHQLGMPLVSDEQHKMLEAYGVWGEKSMYGKTFQGILRTTFLIGTDGRIIKIWRNVKVDGHAEEVLAQVRAL
jgi:thioredoxin-dependent peroxiredoxin